MRFAWLCIAAWFSASIASAQEIELPLGEHFRAGCCIPVVIRSNPNGIELQCELSVPTHVAAGFSGVVPLLMVGTGQTQTLNHPLSPLADNEKLIVTDDAASEWVAKIFPDQRVVSVRLDRSRAGWLAAALAAESVDALLLQNPPDDPQVLRWLAEQVTVVCTARPATTRLPWQPFETGWILRPIGPSKREVLNALANHPPALRVERSAEQRTRILLSASLMVLLSLLPLVSGRRGWRVASGAILLLGIGGLAAFYAWESGLQFKAGTIELVDHPIIKSVATASLIPSPVYARERVRVRAADPLRLMLCEMTDIPAKEEALTPPLSRAYTGERVDPPAQTFTRRPCFRPVLLPAGTGAAVLAREDQWQFVGTNRLTRGESVRPPMVDRMDAVTKTELCLEVDSVGRTTWRFELLPNQRLAFREEVVRTELPSLSRTAELTSPLLDLARAAYAQPTDRISSATSSDDWPTVRVSD